MFPFLALVCMWKCLAFKCFGSVSEDSLCPSTHRRCISWCGAQVCNITVKICLTVQRRQLHNPTEELTMKVRMRLGPSDLCLWPAMGSAGPGRPRLAGCCSVGPRQGSPPAPCPPASSWGAPGMALWAPQEGFLILALADPKSTQLRPCPDVRFLDWSDSNGLGQSEKLKGRQICSSLVVK